jgi:hypothetical protein
MKRSEINKTINEAIKFFKKMNFPLPPYAYFTPSDWAKRSKSYKEVIDCRLGWDVTDVGLGKFEKFGRTIFTLRNGKVNNKSYPKPYAQKIMFLQKEQRMPGHYHKSKTEDIINHGGGILQVKTWKKNNTSKTISLSPGQSICVTPGTCHQFWAKKGTGKVLSMEISSTNDDLTDNIWLDKNINRFPKITEDVKREFVLCSEYNALLSS